MGLLSYIVYTKINCPKIIPVGLYRGKWNLKQVIHDQESILVPSMPDETVPLSTATITKFLLILAALIKLKSKVWWFSNTMWGPNSWIISFSSGALPVHNEGGWVLQLHIYS